MIEAKGVFVNGPQMSAQSGFAVLKREKWGTKVKSERQSAKTIFATPTSTID